MHADDHGHSRRSPQHGSRGHAQEGDPVCGMAVDAETAEHTHEYRGRTWYFCSESCRRKFAAEPERYAGAKEKSAASVSAAADAIYTCPMHPEIRQIGPGNCPKCGMALEPVVAGPGEQPHPELIDMRSEEHTAELQSPSKLVCRLLLGKKKKVTPCRPAGTAASGGVRLVG